MAIDGPAGAGKSTIAKLVGERFNLMYINTGSMYRAVALMAMRNDIEPEMKEELISLIKTLDMHFEGDNVIVNGEDASEEIRMPWVSENVSKYASVGEVREILVDLQRKMSDKYNVIMDGRDIGTVVLKDAPFKFYLTASAEERANRRFNELKQKGLDVDYEDILNDIIKRDYIDSHREVNPLAKAQDAMEIDSSHMTIDQVVETMCRCVAKGMKQHEGE